MNYPFRRSGFRPRLDTVVISIHAGARSQGTYDAEASYAVAFGDEDCERNESGSLDEYESRTQYRALLEALRSALEICKTMIEDDELPCQSPTFIIKTNNKTLIRSMDEWIWDWVDDGGAKANGQQVEHWETVEEIHQTILGIEEDGAEVLFWKVDRADIPDADHLMRTELDS